MSELLKVYKDPQLTSRNPATLAKRAGVTLAAAKSFLRDREEAQVRKRAARLKKAAFVPTGDERGVWIGDTIYLKDYAGANKGRSAIFTILETNSRYVYARALKAPTAAQTAAALESIIEANREENREEKQVAPILKLRTDGGPEFSGAFAQLLEKLDIPHEKTGAGTHERLARLDRFHGTLRRMIGEYFALTNSHVWIDALPALIANYNTRPSRALDAAGKHLAPADIGPEEEQKLREADILRAAEVRKLIDESGVGGLGSDCSTRERRPAQKISSPSRICGPQRSTMFSHGWALTHFSLRCRRVRFQYAFSLAPGRSKGLALY